MNRKLNPESTEHGFWHMFREMERRVEGVLLRSLGLYPSERDQVVENMFVRRHRDAVSYWLQLMLSMGIATVGLVLGSTAVVIGAMLIAPLMGPIVELGMALVIGSPVLTIRSLGRVMGGSLAVVAGAALLTVLLPFQEITQEVASRTSPTALDLLLAVFVALAAAFTTVRSSSETTSSAAGTAISIALVPPLCVIGFGLGVQDPEIAGGASLLFITNLTAILFISVVFFRALGFEHVDAREWEATALAEAPPRGIIHGAVHGLEAIFGSRYGRVLRVAFPLLLVASVSIPLSRALDQVAWEVRARSSVSRILDEALTSRDAVQSMVSISPGQVSTQLYLVGSVEDASDLQDQLLTEIAAATGVVPSVRVVAVPDLHTVRAEAAPQATTPQLPPIAGLGEVRRQVADAVEEVWPVEELGPLLDWQLAVQGDARSRVVFHYLGAPASSAVGVLLARSVSSRVGANLLAEARAYPPVVEVSENDQGLEWLPDLMRSLDAVRATRNAHACVTIPGERILQRNASARRVASLIRAEVERLPAERVSVEANSTGGWSVRLARGPCVEPVVADSTNAAGGVQS